jgi:hypothetical protein
MFETLDAKALTVAAVVFCLVTAVAWFAKRFAVTDGIGLIALIVLPIAAYGVASGYVSKITTPGGWGAEFRAVAAATIKPSPLVEEVRDIEIIEKAGLDAIQRYRETIEVGKPIAISLELGRVGYYAERAIAEYIRAFKTFDPSLTVIFVERLDGGADNASRFVASTNGNSVLAALELQDYDRRLVRAMEEADLLALRRLLVLTTNSVGAETTNAEALRMMLADGVDSIVKTDERGRAIGIVRREVIVSQLLVKLAGE